MSAEWTLAVCGGLIGPFVLAMLVGLCLPRSHRATRSVVIHQSAETVWSAVASLDRLPSWWMMMRSMDPLPPRDGRQRFRQTFANRRGRDRSVEIEVVESRPPSRLVTRIAEERSPFQGEWTYEVVPADGGSRVTLSEHGQVSRPLIRFFFRTMMSKSFFISSYLRALGQKFGEKVEPK